MDFRQRLEQNRNQPASNDVPEPDEHFSCPYFGTDKNKSPVCIDFRLRNGKRRALPYALFTEIRYDADTGIEIHSGEKRIRITGRNLSRMFDYLVAYRVRYVHEDIGRDAEEDGIFVGEILMEDLDV